MLEFVIWWTGDAECKAIGELLPSWCPEYMQQEWNSRLGRAGRCRLWVSRELNGAPTQAHFDVDRPALPLELRLVATSAAGIVIRARDVSKLVCIPGIVTDVHLRRVWA